MRVIIITFIVILPFIAKGQAEQTVSSVCKQVSMQWKLDSTACKGNRLPLSRLFSNAKTDSISKAFLFTTLGKPNLIQKYFVGYPERRNYVEYIYYIYKDECPKIKIEGAAIGFVFDETEMFFVRMEDHDYCG
jgi:hypothetical protein